MRRPCHSETPHRTRLDTHATLHLDALALLTTNLTIFGFGRRPVASYIKNLPGIILRGAPKTRCKTHVRAAHREDCFRFLLQFYNENYKSIHMKTVIISTRRQSVPQQYYTG
jgi:hypothetical protein